MKQFVALLFLCWPLLLVAQPTPDPKIEKARKLAAAADNLYQIERYEEALAKYQEAYDLSSAPALLFNIAQCYRLTNKPKEAIKSYRAFLEGKPDTPYRKEVEEKIAALEAEVAKMPPEPPPKTVPASTSLPATLVTSQPYTEPSKGFPWKPFLLPAGLALASVGAGAGAHTLDNRLENLRASQNSQEEPKAIDTSLLHGGRLVLGLSCDILWIASAALGTKEFLQLQKKTHDSQREASQ